MLFAIFRSLALNRYKKYDNSIEPGANPEMASFAISDLRLALDSHTMFECRIVPTVLSLLLNRVKAARETHFFQLLNQLKLFFCDAILAFDLDHIMICA